MMRFFRHTLLLTAVVWALQPLRAAEDAVVVDTSGNEFEESVEQVLKTVEEHLNDKA